ncbi:unnamed protein product, partial [Polarella glacialis]
SGLELLFLDGGATVAGLVGAGAAALGYEQRRRDDEELAESLEEFQYLRVVLVEAKVCAHAGHRAVTAAWRGPLSLFGQREEAAAAERGVPAWAAAAACAARGLADEAAELQDLADVYEAQLMLAARVGRSLRRAPVRQLEAQLERLSLDLTTQVPSVILAREAFDALDAVQSQSEPPRHVSRALEVASAAAAVRELRHMKERARKQQLDQVGDTDSEDRGEVDDDEELPIAILRDRKLLGELL